MSTPGSFRSLVSQGDGFPVGRWTRSGAIETGVRLRPRCKAHSLSGRRTVETIALARRRSAFANGVEAHGVLVG